MIQPEPWQVLFTISWYVGTMRRAESSVKEGAQPYRELADIIRLNTYVAREQAQRDEE